MLKRAAQSPIDSQRKTKKHKKEIEVIPDDKVEFLEVRIVFNQFSLFPVIYLILFEGHFDQLYCGH